MWKMVETKRAKCVTNIYIFTIYIYIYKENQTCEKLMIENNWTLKTFCLFFNFIENWRDQLILLCWTWFLVKNCRTKFWFIFFFHWNSFKFSTLIFENSHFLKPGRLVFIGMNFELISEDIFLVFLATVILVGIVAKLAFIFLGINTGSISSAIIWS